MYYVTLWNMICKKKSFRPISLHVTFEFYQIYLGKITIDVGETTVLSLTQINENMLQY
jgi:hypothetical protein